MQLSSGDSSTLQVRVREAYPGDEGPICIIRREERILAEEQYNLF
jgi:hypothetical protein